MVIKLFASEAKPHFYKNLMPTVFEHVLQAHSTNKHPSFFASFFAWCKIIKNRQLSKFKVNFSLIYSHNFINSVSTKTLWGCKSELSRRCRTIYIYFWWLLDIFSPLPFCSQPHHTYMHHRVSSEPKQNTIIHNTLYIHIVEMKIPFDAISY